MFAHPKEFEGNAFKEVAIPKPSMMFGRYGYQILPDGSYAENDSEGCPLQASKIQQIEDQLEYERQMAHRDDDRSDE